MSDHERPVTPTRIIPAGDELPAPAAPPPLPPPVPPPPPAEPPEPPAWDWGPAPEPAPVEVHHTHTVEVVLVPAGEEKPRRGWSWLRPYQTLAALVIAMIPSPAYGHSLTSAWSTVLHDERDGGLGAPYGLAIGALALALLLDRARKEWWCRTLLVIALIGGTGALGWYDPITWLTGVRP